jgi:hypothetical protein
MIKACTTLLWVFFLFLFSICFGLSRFVCESRAALLFFVNYKLSIINYILSLHCQPEFLNFLLTTMKLVYISDFFVVSKNSVWRLSDLYTFFYTFFSINYKL